MRRFYIILLIIITLPEKIISQTSNIYSQKYKWVKSIVKTNGENSMGSVSFFESNKRLYQFISFSGDSARFENSSYTSFNDANLIIIVCDSNGNKTNEILLNGITSLSPTFLNDGSFISSTDGSETYICNNQIFRKIRSKHSYKGNINNIIKVDLKGNIFSMDTFFVESTIKIGGFDSTERTFYVLLGDVRDYDSLEYINNPIFKIGYSTLLKIDESGRILKFWQFDGHYVNFDLFYNVLCTWGESKISANCVDSLFFKVYDLGIEKNLWSHTISGINGIVGLDINQYGVLVALSHKNKLYIDGEPIERISDSGENMLQLLSFDAAGKRKWLRSAILGNTFVVKMNSFEKHIDLLAYKYNNIPGEFRWQKGELTSSSLSNGSNRIVLDLQGNLILNYAIPFGYPAEIYLNSIESTYYINKLLEDTLTINKTKYSVIGNPVRKEEYLFIKAEVDSNPINIKNQFRKYKIFLFPNPTNGFFKIGGDYSPYTIGVIKIYDLEGDLLLTTRQPIGSNVDISNFERGLYFVTIDFGNMRFSQKLIKF